MPLLKALLRSPYFYLSLFFAALFVYVPASETYLKEELVKPPFDNPEHLFGFGERIPNSVLEELDWLDSDYFNPSCKRDFWTLNRSLADMYGNIYLLGDSFSYEIEAQKKNPFLRLAFAFQRLNGGLGLDKKAQKASQHYKEAQDGYAAARSELYSFIVNNDCFDATYTLNLSSATETAHRGLITMENENPYKLPPDRLQTYETPIFLDVYGLPNWLEVTPQQTLLLPGESETLEFTATCPSSDNPAMYEAKVALFQPPAFVDMVEVSLECPSTT